MGEEKQWYLKKNSRNILRTPQNSIWFIRHLPHVGHLPHTQHVETTRNGPFYGMFKNAWDWLTLWASAQYAHQFCRQWFYVQSSNHIKPGMFWGQAFEELTTSPGPISLQLCLWGPNGLLWNQKNMMPFTTWRFPKEVLELNGSFSGRISQKVDVLKWGLPPKSSISLGFFPGGKNPWLRGSPWRVPKPGRCRVQPSRTHDWTRAVSSHSAENPIADVQRSACCYDLNVTGRSPVTGIRKKSTRPFFRNSLIFFSWTWSGCTRHACILIYTCVWSCWIEIYTVHIYIYNIYIYTYMKT